MPHDIDRSANATPSDEPGVRRSHRIVWLVVVVAMVVAAVAGVTFTAHLTLPETSNGTEFPLSGSDWPADG
jgi:hypothetical protein